VPAARIVRVVIYCDHVAIHPCLLCEPEIRKKKGRRLSGTSF
jgi:hypothetical protein